MAIEYRDIQEFDKKELQDLFLSVEWSSGHYPDKLVAAMKNYGSVFTAWDCGKLIGLISTMDDGVMNAYIHYLLVNPTHQGKGIGRQLVDMTKEHYKEYLRIVLVAYDSELDFYINGGFAIAQEKTAMFITTLDT